jgi:hypothetical protein
MNDESIKAELKEYNITDASLKEIEKKYGELKIDGIKDKFGYAQVKEAAKVVKSMRLDVESKRKELKASALERGRLIDAEAKRIKGQLEPIEQHLVSEKKSIDDEKERIKKEEEHRKQKIIQDRVVALSEVGVTPNIFLIQGMTDDQFEETLKQETKRYNAEQEEKRRQEAIRLEKEAEEQRAREEAEKLRLEKEAEERRLLEEEKEKLRKKIDELSASRQLIQNKLMSNVVDDVQNQEGQPFVVTNQTVTLTSDQFDENLENMRLLKEGEEKRALQEEERRKRKLMQDSQDIVATLDDIGATPLPDDPEITITLTADQHEFAMLIDWLSDDARKPFDYDGVIDNIVKQIKEQLNGNN